MPGLIVNCDWGTTWLRLRAVELPNFTVAAEVRSADAGVASLANRFAPDARPGGYRSILANALRQLSARLPNSLNGAPVLISGMASSSIGWRELPYARLPLALDGSQLSRLELEPINSDVGTHRVVLISGACTDNDVMRGEETESRRPLHVTGGSGDAPVYSDQTGHAFQAPAS